MNSPTHSLSGAKRLSSLEKWLHSAIILIAPILGIWIGVAHGIPRAIGFYFFWYATVRLLARVCDPYIDEDGSWFGIGLSFSICMLERGRMTGGVACKTGLSIIAWIILPWTIAYCLACIHHLFVPLAGGLVFVVWLVIRPRSSEPTKSSNTAEQEFRRMKELGVINRMPDDPEAVMEQVKTLTRLGNEWAESMQNKQGMMGNDGFPLYETVYPDAIEHYVKASGFGLSESDRHNVTQAALHFGAYCRREGRFPQDENGEPDWRDIYGQIQDHFRQWTKGMIQ